MALSGRADDRGSRAVSWLLLLGLLALGSGFAYWLLITTEGTYLGARTVALLYDRVADRYDQIKRFKPEHEQALLARPILWALRERPAPLVLDVATGTGRIPMLLLESVAFDGRVVGLDLARRMLALAARKVTRYQERVAFVWQTAMQLPFPDNSFDLVSCLEALEFIPRPKRALVEIVRVVRPGGLVVTTRRRGWERKLMPGKCWSAEECRALLGALGLERVRLLPWQTDYDLVWAWKPDGGPLPPDDRSERWFEMLLRCPACSGQPLLRQGATVCCSRCGRCYPVAADGVLELAGSRSPRPDGVRR